MFHFTGSNEKRAIHSHSLQHVLRFMSSQLLMEPSLSKMAVLLRDRITKDLLKHGALERIGLGVGVRERERVWV